MFSRHMTMDNLYDLNVPEYLPRSLGTRGWSKKHLFQSETDFEMMPTKLKHNEAPSVDVRKEESRRRWNEVLVN